ncbi:MAG: alpha/beta hydrolase [Nocardiaceae bacterium]|nr:alpha/beta hydrolase [Nocardiaceae bacterium]
MTWITTAALSAACATPEPDVPLFVTHVGEGDLSTIVITPPGGNPKGIVVFFHGFNDTEDVLVDDPLHRDLTEALTARGYAVVASRAYGNAFGNPASRSAYVNLLAFAKHQYGDKPVYVVAESMGAIAALTILGNDIHRQLAVQGLVLVSPAVDISHPPATFRQQIADAFGTSPIGESNPINIPGEQFSAMNIRIYASPEDQIVPPAGQADAFAAKVRRFATVDTIACHGVHGDASCLPADDITDWLDTR